MSTSVSATVDTILHTEAAPQLQVRLIHCKSRLQR